MAPEISEQELLLKKFPHLLASCNFTAYEGFVNAGGVDFLLSLRVPNYPLLTEMSLQCSWHASYLLKNHKTLLEEWIHHESLSVFLENLKNLLSLLLKEKSLLCVNSGESIAAESFKLLSSELSRIGLHHVVSLSACLTSVTLKTIDGRNRVHEINVNVGKNYPHMPVQILAELPEKAMDTIKKSTMLNDIFESFVSKVDCLQGLWNALDAIDSQCCVLDPEHPTRKDTGRRILIGNNISLYINMDEDNVSAVPNITLLGPEQTVQQFQSKLARNLQVWNPSVSIVDNMKQVLELESMPLKGNCDGPESLVQEGECCVCYTLQMDGQLPVEICDDSRCACVFHTYCLFQWLETVPGSYQSFNRIYGACPNCGTPISCAIPK